MPVSIKPIPFKPPRLIGISERMMADHYEQHYGGAVTRLHAIEKQVASIDWASEPRAALKELQHQKLAAINSMILHEVYFDGLGGADGLGSAAVAPTGPLGEAIESDFGSVASWTNAFTAMGKALGDGSGWVILGWCSREGRLVNDWATGDGLLRAGSIPILALDLFEHAYRLDYGADVGAYVDAFMKNLHWDRPAQRFAAREQLTTPDGGQSTSKTTIAVEQLMAMQACGEQPLLLDICLADDIAKRHDTLPGAAFLPAENRAEWIEQLANDRPIVAYCMYGFQVSGDAVADLQRRGYDARRLAGGIASWRAIGGRTEPLKKS